MLQQVVPVVHAPNMIGSGKGQKVQEKTRIKMDPTPALRMRLLRTDDGVGSL